MEGKDYELELPTGYESALTIDATDKKFALRMNLAAIVPIVPALLLARRMLRNVSVELSARKMLLFIGAMLAYIVLHELLHGIAYRLLTHRRLSFGLKLTCAYCGVPDIYCYRRTALISLLAPFTVFTVVFGALSVFPGDTFLRVCSVILLGLYVGGCAGDLYDTWLYLTRFRDPLTLMRDTGPAQTFYVKAPE
jgi:hypothetical protein